MQVGMRCKISLCIGAMQQQQEGIASLAKDSLGLGVQSFPLRRLASHRTEARDAERLASLHSSDTPLLQCARCKRLLASRRCSLAHYLARLALDQSILREAAHSLRLLATEDSSPGILATSDGAHFFDLLHGLHSRLHGGLRGFHALIAGFAAAFMALPLAAFIA